MWFGVVYMWFGANMAGPRDKNTFLSIYLSISTASPPLGDYMQVPVSAVLVEEMLLKIKSSHKIC